MGVAGFAARYRAAIVLLLAVVCLLSSTLPAAAQTCNSVVPFPLSSATSGAGVVSDYLFSAITLDASSIGLQITQVTAGPVVLHGPGVSSSPSGNIRLGLYQATPNTSPQQYTLLGQGPNVAYSNLADGSSFTSTLTTPFTISSAGTYYVAIFTDQSTFIILQALFTQTGSSPSGSSSYASSDASLPGTVTPTSVNQNQFESGLTLCAGGSTGDPIIHGFHGQKFYVAGVPNHVYNLLSLSSMQVSTRFVQLNKGQSMLPKQMKAAIAAHALSESPLPHTWPWMHNGTYQGEVGIKTRAMRVRVVSGGFVDGFASVTVNNMPVVISNNPLQLGDGVELLRPSAHVLHVTHPGVRFTLVNSDRFINIEDARLLQKPEELQIAGLLGQTAYSEWKARRGVEANYELSSDDLFGDDFRLNKYGVLDRS